MHEIHKLLTKKFWKEKNLYLIISVEFLDGTI